MKNSNGKTNIFHAALLSSIAVSAVSTAFAQADLQGDRDTIVVTAQKREQAITDTPISVQALGEDQLSNANFRDFAEAITLVPGASESLTNSVGLRQYQIRGVAQALGDPTVGYYFGDAAYFFYGQLFAPQGRTFDMSRVEVLRGPQSTLYGNGAMGGVVRFIPNAPNLNDFEAQARGGWLSAEGGESSHYVDGAVSVPLIQDKLAVRGVVSYEEIGGYQETLFGDEDFNDGENLNARISVLAKPVDDLELEFLYMHNDTDQTGGTLLLSTEPPVSIGSAADFNDVSYDIFSGTLSYDLGFASLTSATTHIDYLVSGGSSVPFPGAPGGLLSFTQGRDATALNNETRLVSQHEGPLQWILGVYYSDTETSQPLDSNLPALVPATVQTFESESISFFGELSYDLFDGMLVPLVGLRYFTDDRATATELVGVGNIGGDEATFDSVNPRFNLSFNPSDSALYYINVAKGFRSGNFNNPTLCGGLRAGGVPCEDSVDSDSIWSYEIGTKQSLSGNQAIFDVAFYYQDWSDIRQPVAFAGIFQDIQVGDARIFGIDLGLTVAPDALPGFSMTTTANWNDAEFDGLLPAVAAVSGEADGSRLPFTPEWTTSISANYERELASGWFGESSVTYSHIAPQVGVFGGAADGDSRNLLNIRAGARDDNIGLYFVAKNVLNENGIVYSQAPTGGLTAFSQDYPRQLGVEATFSF